MVGLSLLNNVIASEAKKETKVKVPIKSFADFRSASLLELVHSFYTDSKKKYVINPKSHDYLSTTVTSYSLDLNFKNLKDTLGLFGCSIVPSVSFDYLTCNYNYKIYSTKYINAYDIVSRFSLPDLAGSVGGGLSSNINPSSFAGASAGGAGSGSSAISNSMSSINPFSSDKKDDKKDDSKKDDKKEIKVDPASVPVGNDPLVASTNSGAKTNGFYLRAVDANTIIIHYLNHHELTYFEKFLKTVDKPFVARNYRLDVILISNRNSDIKGFNISGFLNLFKSRAKVEFNDNTATSATSPSFVASISGVDIGGVLRIVRDTSDYKILHSPSVVLDDFQTANVSYGEDYPILTSVKDQYGNLVTTPNYRNIGVVLNAKIGSSFSASSTNYIDNRNMAVNITLSSLSGTLGNYPIISQSVLNTVVPISNDIILLSNYDNSISQKSNGWFAKYDNSGNTNFVALLKLTKL